MTKATQILLAVSLGVTGTVAFSCATGNMNGDACNVKEVGHIKRDVNDERDYKCVTTGPGSQRWSPMPTPKPKPVPKGPRV